MSKLSDVQKEHDLTKTSFLSEIMYSKRKCFSTLYWPLVVPIQLITSPEHAANFQRSDGDYSKDHPNPPSTSLLCNSWATSHYHKRKGQNPSALSCHCLFMSQLTSPILP